MIFCRRPPLQINEETTEMCPLVVQQHHPSQKRPPLGTSPETLPRKEPTKTGGMNRRNDIEGDGSIITASSLCTYCDSYDSLIAQSWIGHKSCLIGNWIYWTPITCNYR
jgi:hypothetical protein